MVRAVLVASGLIALGAGALSFLACGSDGDTTDADGIDGGEGGSTSSSSGGPREAGANGVTADGGINPDGAGPGGNTSQLACGATSCPIPAETCCVEQVSNGRSYSCVAGSTCPQTSGDVAALKCSSSANCASGTVCCVTLSNGVVSSECKTSCTPDGGRGGDTAQLCDPRAGDSAGCPESQPCSNDNIGDWNLSHAFGTCGGRGN